MKACRLPRLHCALALRSRAARCSSVSAGRVVPRVVGLAGSLEIAPVRLQQLAQLSSAGLEYSGTIPDVARDLNYWL